MKYKKISLHADVIDTPPSSSNADDQLSYKKTYRISGGTRSTANLQEFELKNDEIVQLEFDDETSWFCDGDSIHQVFPEAAGLKRSASDYFEVPVGMAVQDNERGIVSNILLKALHVFARKAVQTEVGKLAAELERKQLENQSGLYQVNGQFTLEPFKPANIQKPYLLFLHGTNSSTKGSFSELAETELWRFIQSAYKDQVLAFQHETLTKSPLLNVLELVAALPDKAEVHIISHSRGGLVGDVLARFAATSGPSRGFTPDEIRYLAEEGHREQDVKLIKALQEAFRRKSITVSKFIRVACPASGTTVISRRLDHYFNIAFNLVGLGTGWAGSPVYTAFRNLVSAVVSSKNDPSVLPGLEAMDPDSPFVRVMNSPALTSGDNRTSIDASLTVISGNCGVAFSLKALVVIAGRIFFRKDNDLVVNTSSMYLGTRRRGIVQYMFDEGGGVDHFHYFSNTRTNAAILLALQSPGDALSPGFRKWSEGTLTETERNALLKLDGGQLMEDNITGKRPIAIILPGIMGSNLSKGDKLLWINYVNMLRGGLEDLKFEAVGVEAKSIVKSSYKQLADDLKSEYDVLTWAYDWRKSLRDCATDLNNKITELLALGQPIRIIGHSMGGVLVRDFIVNHPDTWERLNKSTGFRLLFLGAPLGGSFRIPAVLFGMDDIINKLGMIDIFHSKYRLVKDIFRNMPGIQCLLPLTEDEGNDFSKPATWKNLRAGVNGGDWPIPEDNTQLKAFQAYRDKAKTGMEQIDYSSIVYIAGKDKATPCGYTLDEFGGEKELKFLYTAEGDQSVTWESGIPKQLIDKNAVYYVDVSHGRLANEPSMFKGIKEILLTGSTNLLSRSRPVVRGDERVFVARPGYDLDTSMEGVEHSILGLGGTDAPVAARQQLRVTVMNGDLRYAKYPVMAGHFLNDGIMGAEWAIDKIMGGALSQRHKLGLYPGEIGTSKIHLSTREGFPGALVIGLGKPGELNAFLLSQSVEQGISNYLLSLNEDNLGRIGKGNAPGNAGITSLLIGNGYGGLGNENAARAVITGVSNANDKIRQVCGADANVIENLEFIELFEENALAAFNAVRRMSTDEDQSVSVALASQRIGQRPGFQKRPFSDYSKNWWTRISVMITKTDDGKTRQDKLEFSMSTGGAKEEKQTLYTSPGIIEELVNEASVNNQWNKKLAITIFELLIPYNFKEQLKKQNNIIWILDKDTASYPWELLQDGKSDSRPLAVTAGMVRQLATKEYKLKINEVANDKALVIADPDTRGAAPALPGAQEEGNMVNGIFKSNGLNAVPIIRGDPGQIIQALFSDEYKIIHLAGHGIFNADPEKPSGMLIGENVFLTTREIYQLSTTPELVFVNCCFLGKTDGASEEFYQERFRLAANIGTQLIDNGVKAVIAAGWAVNDAAAKEFTRVFYENMFAGYDFGTAVRVARERIYKNYPGSNTWGAYQCYGDPFYRIRISGSAAAVTAPNFAVSEEAWISLYNLNSKVESGTYDPDDVRRSLQQILEATDKAGLRDASITELEAAIYFNLADYMAAIKAYEFLFRQKDSSYQVSALEKYANARSRQALVSFGSGKFILNSLLKNLEKVILDLNSLCELAITPERLSLLGSVHKRRSIVLGQLAKKISDYRFAASYYHEAYEMDHGNLTGYALNNWLQLECILVLHGDRTWGSGKSRRKSYATPAKANTIRLLERLIAKINSGSRETLDYWDYIALANTQLTLFMLRAGSSGTTARSADVKKSYMAAWALTGSAGKKASETEHFEFLLDALANVETPQAAAIRKCISLLSV